MVHKPKSVKYKVIAGYVLLFATAVLSVWFVYSEILKIARPSQDAGENAKIIRISNTIATLYESEAAARTAILTGNPKDLTTYYKLNDSISLEINAVKKIISRDEAQKFDSVQLLLNRKKISINELTSYRKKYSESNTFTKAITGVYGAKDSIWSQIKPVRSTKPYQWRKVVNQLLTPRQLDSLSKLPVSNDSLAMAFEKVLGRLLVQDNKLRYQLYRKEQNLLDENRIISDKLRVILASVESGFIKKTYQTVQSNQRALEHTIQTMAWVGAITFLFLILFAGIIIRDLSINQNYRRQLEVLNVENENLLRSKTMLMATVTHDLQTPLGSIMGFYELLKDSGVSPKQSQYLANIKESAGYILKLVNDLLDFSKLENNRITIENNPFNFKTGIEAVCTALQPMALAKNIELNWDIDDDLDAFYISDPYRLKQVLTNLVGNAIKFTAEGSVEITARTDRDTIIISVLDTGIGIAPESQGAVFNEFTQANDGIEKKFGGTGLGLTISKRIIELLGGSISLESTPGQGSIFTIMLPLIRSNENVKTSISSIKKGNPPILRGKILLFVDDDPVQLKLMKEVMEGYGATVITEGNPGNVPAILKENSVDLVLTDLQMPVMDGFDLLALINRQPDAAIASTPVIALSGQKDLKNDDYVARGFAGGHPKPVQLDGLLKLVAGILEKDDDSGAQISDNNNAKIDGSLFNLRSLSQFTQNDPASLKAIIEVFIESAADNCEALKMAAATADINELSLTAHKMIPMLKQMEVHSIVALLVPLEDKLITGKAGIDKRVKEICASVTTLCKQLQIEVG